MVWLTGSCWSQEEYEEETCGHCKVRLKARQVNVGGRVHEEQEQRQKKMEKEKEFASWTKKNQEDEFAVLRSETTAASTVALCLIATCLIATE
jgi:hypothetical protein